MLCGGDDRSNWSTIKSNKDNKLRSLSTDGTNKYSNISEPGVRILNFISKKGP